MSRRRPVPLGNRRRALVLGALLVTAVAGCGNGSRDDYGGDGFAPDRIGRLGSLRDLVVVARSGDSAASALLVDRFEATQGDWGQFAGSEAGARVQADDVTRLGNPALPVGGMTLEQAHAFARWRYCRLPTAAEWRLATVGDLRRAMRFPWGQRLDATRANTADLRLGRTTPVGTFESGRRQGGDWPYDLIGNVREWTVTVPDSWFEASGVAEGGSFRGAQRYALGLAAVRAWSPAPGMLPTGLIVAVGGRRVPRRVVGVDYETPMIDVFEQRFDTQAGDERASRTGVRVYTTVGELLARLVADDQRVDDAGRRQVRQLLRREGHHELFARALEESTFAALDLPEDTVGGWLLALLRDGSGRR